MATMIFVHGTGVREAAYKKSYELIAPRIRALGHEPAECLWGDKYGSKFSGAALPGPRRALPRRSDRTTSGSAGAGLAEPSCGSG